MLLLFLYIAVGFFCFGFFLINMLKYEIIQYFTCNSNKCTHG